MDNGTMVEALKYLNYCQLAKNSQVSKRFRDLIQTHRHKLALLYVDSIRMVAISCSVASTAITVFDKELSPATYNEWIVCNNYSKQTPVKSQAASEESTKRITNGYRLYAYAHYKDANRSYDTKMIFSARVELNNENWPLFQHFVRLATDPFIYIDNMDLAYQNDVLNLLAEAMNSDPDRLQCKRLDFDLKGNSQESITWIKNNVRCNQLYISGDGDLNQNEAFLDFFLTGANCTPSIGISYRDLSKVVTDFVQKFMDLKNSGKSQVVEAIDGRIGRQSVELFKRDYANFLVKDEKNYRSAVFEYINNDIGKKLQLNTKIYELPMALFLIKIISL